MNIHLAKNLRKQTKKKKQGIILHFRPTRWKITHNFGRVTGIHSWAYSCGIKDWIHFESWKDFK